MNIKHIALRVKNLEESILFYETIAGLSVARRFKADPGELAFMSAGEGKTEIELICMPEGEYFQGKGMFICFETDDLEQMHKLAVEKGYKPSEIRNPGDNTRYFYVYDPNGVSVQLRVFPK